MSKKSTVIAVIAALAIVGIAAALFLAPRSTLSPTAPAAVTTPGPTPGASVTGSETGPVQSATSTPAPNRPGVETSKPVTSIGPFPALPVPKLPVQKAGAPVAPGQTLAPLTSAPDNTISALKTGAVPDGAAYSITMRPYGIGPSIALGSRLAIRVDGAKPLKGAPSYSRIVNANLLVLADTVRGGTVTEGGSYSATLTFRSDGAKLLPVLTNAKAAK